MVKIYTQEVAAAKAGMSVKTARKYIACGQLVSELKRKRHWKTRSNVFDSIWLEIEDMLKKSPALEAKTILEFLMKRDENKYKQEHLRTLQRIIRNWKALNGKEKAVIFTQKLIPGKQSQSDFTCMNSIGIMIGGKAFKHLLFHFMLPYSRWEYASICYAESFESLSQGYEGAVWSLGGIVKEHRTDNLAAATKKGKEGRVFTEKWQEVMKYYGVTASRNNPGVSHENGSVEKSHDLLKSAIEQHLYLRGSNNFASIEDYKIFIDKIILDRNAGRKELLKKEMEVLKPLPDKKFYAPLVIDVGVSRFSTVRILKSTYSVPSRLIGYRLRAYIYYGEIKLYYGDKLIQVMTKLKEGEAINYRHIINSLIRKPNAFVNYQYKDSLFPSAYFRKAYDKLFKHYPSNCNKQYLKILQLAAIGSENEVESALKILLRSKIIPNLDKVKELLHITNYSIPQVKVNMPVLSNYDSLLAGNI